VRGCFGSIGEPILFDHPIGHDRDQPSQLDSADSSVEARTCFETFNEELRWRTLRWIALPERSGKRSERADLLSQSMSNAELTLEAPHGTARERVPHHRPPGDK